MWNSWRVGVFLAFNQLRRSSIWASALIIVIMMLTFLNLVVINGILVGLIEGSSAAHREQYAGDVFITTLPTERHVVNSQSIEKTLSTYPEVLAFSPRFLDSVTVEAGHRQRRGDVDQRDEVSTQVIGIDPAREDAVTHMSRFVAEGEYLNANDFDAIMIGSDLLDRYARAEFGLGTLENIQIGDRVLVTVNNHSREMRVKGIVKNKIGEVTIRIFMVDRQLRQMAGASDLNVGEIAVRLQPGASPEIVRDNLKAQGFGTGALIRTWEESLGEFFEDIRNTFNSLGQIIGGIGLIVASITIFIIIFINAITRRKFIGILKGIGISGAAIEISYICQSMFYSLLGSGAGLLLLYGFLQPFIAEHPIDFPFSDGILVATPVGTAWRVGLMIAATLIAGYVPAKLIIRQNTLNSILGRK